MSTATWSSTRGGGISGSAPYVEPRLLRAFHATDYRAANATARIGRRSGSIDRLLSSLGAQGGAFMTAWNPGARRWPLERNRRMDRALQGWLRRLRTVAGAGSAPGWREEHWLVIADPRRVATLARRFRQAAIVIVRRGQAARLGVLAADRPGAPL